MSTTALLARLTGQLPVGFRTCKQESSQRQTTRLTFKEKYAKLFLSKRESLPQIICFCCRPNCIISKTNGWDCMHAESRRSRFAAIESLCCNSLYMCSATIASRGSRIQLPAGLWQSVPRRSQRTPEGHRYCNRSVCRVYQYA